MPPVTLKYSKALPAAPKTSKGERYSPDADPDTVAGDTAKVAPFGRTALVAPKLAKALWSRLTVVTVVAFAIPRLARENAAAAKRVLNIMLLSEQSFCVRYV